MMVEGIVRLFLRQQRADLQTLFTACVFILINEVISIVMISLIIGVISLPTEIGCI